MATCLCDAFFDDAARATVEVLEHVGCEVLFPEGQTCCGQPAFNAGDWNASRKVVRHMMDVFEGEDPILIPSGSCAAMVFHGAKLAFEKEPDYDRVQAFAKRVWEISDYLVHGLGIVQWEGFFPYRVSFHRSCHTRGTQSGESAIALLKSIDGLELLPVGEYEQCCGFGGTFSVSFPNASEAIGELKVQHLLEHKPDYLAAVDMGCGIHIGGIVKAQGQDIELLHVAQILRNALNNKQRFKTTG